MPDGPPHFLRSEAADERRVHVHDVICRTRGRDFGRPSLNCPRAWGDRLFPSAPPPVPHQGRIRSNDGLRHTRPVRPSPTGRSTSQHPHRDPHVAVRAAHGREVPPQDRGHRRGPLHPEAERILFQEMQWLGLDYDPEGPDGFVRQSARLSRHMAVVEEWLAKGIAYRSAKPPASARAPPRPGPKERRSSARRSGSGPRPRTSPTRT